jgi:hypothetical protein
VRSSFDQMSASPGSGPAVMSATIGSGSADLSLTSMTGDVTLLARHDAPASGQPPADGQAQAGQAAAPTATGPGEQR